MTHRATFALLAFALVLALGAAAAASERDADPWRGMNEETHGLNEGIDRHAFEPVARGWRKMTPSPLRNRVRSFFDNLNLPRTIVNDLLQGELGSGARHTVRFLVNSTLGIAGLFDPAGMSDIEHDPEDFGQTLGVWGIGPGPYLVLPLYGPSSLRDTIALPFDLALNPTFWVGEAAVSGANAIGLVNQRSDALELISGGRESAIDYYAFVRDAWLQNRERVVTDGASAPDEDFYDIEELDESELDKSELDKLNELED